MKIEVGQTGTHHAVRLDIETLLSTRLLVTADSGGGKTVLLKRLCEQMAEKVPIIIIDPEGEFAPLREKYNFVLVGPGGETPADPRSAGLVAQTLLKLKASAILDIYEMPESKRHEFVKLFCDGLINSPKSLWHPTVVIVDEAHMFCPEKGTGESLASDSVKALATRGRKRGICPIFATQRLAEFSKGASSMCLNRLVGGTFEDVNLTRAVQVLSVPNDQKNTFVAEIKLLEPGWFYALGRAICKERTLFKVGPIETAHGSAALKYAQSPPPPPAEIARLLPKLADLPKAAEEKAKTEAELRAEIRALKHSLKAVPANKPAEPDNSAVIARALRPFRDLLGEAMKIIVKLEAFGNFAHLKDEELNALIDSVKREVKKLATDKLGAKERELALLKREANALAARIEKLVVTTEKRIHIDVAVGSPKTPDAEIQPKEKPSGERQGHAAATLARDTAARHPEYVEMNGDGQITAPEKRVLQAVAEFAAIGNREPTRATIAAWLSVRSDTGSFKRYISRLREAGYLIPIGAKSVTITAAGLAFAGPVKAPESTAAFLERAGKIFGGTAEKMLRYIHSHYPEGVTREEIAEHVNNKSGTGSFKSYISDLRSAGLITETRDKKLVASEMMFID